MSQYIIYTAANVIISAVPIAPYFMSFQSVSDIHGLLSATGSSNFTGISVSVCISFYTGTGTV
jgi:hypothetical protein